MALKDPPSVAAKPPVTMSKVEQMRLAFANGKAGGVGGGDILPSPSLRPTNTPTTGSRVSGVVVPATSVANAATSGFVTAAAERTSAVSAKSKATPAASGNSTAPPSALPNATAPDPTIRWRGLDVASMTQENVAVLDDYLRRLAAEWWIDAATVERRSTEVGTSDRMGAAASSSSVGTLPISPPPGGPPPLPSELLPLATPPSSGSIIAPG